MPKTKRQMPPPRPPKREKPTAPSKVFRIGQFGDTVSGEKVLIYAESGMGKTTLASLAPDPVFIAIDDGSRKIKNHNTGEDLIYVPDVANYVDVRGALQQSGLFDNHKSVIVDTGTELQPWAVQFILDTYKLGGGGTAHNLRSYGWGEGYAHLVDVMRFVLQDLDRLVAKGKHVVILCQNSAINKANPGGEDFIKDGPDLYHDKRFSVRDSYIAWADHVVKIDYGDTTVDKKKVYGTTMREVFVKPEPHFVAKSRTLPHDIERITFDDPADDSFWGYLLEGATDDDD